jgi:Uma2 family endonuclease
MAVQTRRITARDFLALPTTNLPHELIHGEEIMSPSPTLSHQLLSSRLFKLLERLVPDGIVLYAPLDVYLDEENVVQPDVLWAAAGGVCKPVADKYLSGAPDLTVEILSPGTALRDKKDKFRLYEKFGVREYWIIDPDESLLEIWALRESRFVLVDVFGPTDACQSPLLGKVDLKAIFSASA